VSFISNLVSTEACKYDLYCKNNPCSYEDIVDHCSYVHNLNSYEVKAWEKFRPERDSNPWLLRGNWELVKFLLVRNVPVNALHRYWSWVRISFRPVFFSGFNFTAATQLPQCVTLIRTQKRLLEMIFQVPVKTYHLKQVNHSHNEIFLIEFWTFEWNLLLLYFLFVFLKIRTKPFIS